MEGSAIIALLTSAGVPAAATVIIALLMFAMDRFIRARADTVKESAAQHEAERKLLSADETTFRSDMFRMAQDLRAEVERLGRTVEAERARADQERENRIRLASEALYMRGLLAAHGIVADGSTVKILELEGVPHEQTSHEPAARVSGQG